MPKEVVNGIAPLPLVKLFRKESFSLRDSVTPHQEFNSALVLETWRMDRNQSCCSKVPWKCMRGRGLLSCKGKAIKFLQQPATAQMSSSLSVLNDLNATSNPKQPGAVLKSMEPFLLENAPDQDEKHSSVKTNSICQPGSWKNLPHLPPSGKTNWPKRSTL